MTAHRFRPPHEAEGPDIPLDVMADDQPTPEEADESFWGIVRQWETYRHISYLLLSLPLGLLSFIVMVVGFTIGVILVPLYIGLSLLAFTLVLMSRLMRLEARVANRLLSTSIDPPPLLHFHPDGRGWLRTFNEARAPWFVRGAVFLLIRFSFGLVAFVGALITISFIIGTILFPVVAGVAHVLNLPFYPQIFGNPLDSLVEWTGVILLIPITIVGGIHLLEFGAWVWRGLARWLLGGRSPFGDGNAEAE